MRKRCLGEVSLSNNGTSEEEGKPSSLGKTTFLLGGGDGDDGGGHATREEKLEHLGPHLMPCFKLFVTWLVGWLVNDTTNQISSEKIALSIINALRTGTVWITKEERW